MMRFTKRKTIIYLAAFLHLIGAINNGVNESTNRRQKREVATATVLTDKEKQYALFLHNQARSNVAPSSNNMLKMMWDEELAQTAQAYSRKCIYEHSNGIKTSKFSKTSENLYISGPEMSSEVFLKNGIEHWENEKNDYNFTSNTCTDVCGHYIQLVWDDTYAVGCGITTCRDIAVKGETWELGQLLVCHYGPDGNKNNRRPYRRGTPCSVCPRNYWCEDRLCNKANLIGERFFSWKFVLCALSCFLFFV